MQFDEYQKLAARTANFEGKQKEFSLMYLGLGVTSEAGEIADKIKKIMRNENGVISDERRDALLSEVGDTLWYLSQIARLLETPFSEVAEKNIEKLADRAARGVIRSDGDTR